jgi:hypothetical protein
MDFHQALRGIMLNVKAGMSLTDPIAATFSRADATTCATRIKRDGTLETVAANVLRTEWVDLDGDGIRETPGNLLEGSRTNSLLRSEELDNAVWTKTRSSITANATTAPDGTATMDKIVEDATAGATHFAGTSCTITANENVAGSVFLRGDTRSKCWVYVTDGAGANGVRAQVDLSAGTLSSVAAIGTGTLIGSRIEKVGSNYRVSVSGSLGGGITTGWVIVFLADAAGSITYNGDGASGLYAWGAQIERASAFASSYIKTVASTVTRAVDNFTMPFTFGPIDLTIMARIARQAWADATGDLGVFPGIYSLGNDTGTLYSRMYGDQVTRTIQADLITGVNSSFAARTLPAGTSITGVAQIKNILTGGQAALDVGSGQSAFGSVATIRSAWGSQTLRLGNVTGAGANQLYGVLLELKIASRLRTLAEMLAL